MGVALENARLFDETKRLLAETDQRAAELALINEIGSALAQAARFRRHHRARRRSAAGHLRRSRLGTCSWPSTTRRHEPIAFPYEIDDGKRIQSESIELGQGLTSIVISSNRPLRFGTLDEQIADGGIVPAHGRGRQRPSPGWACPSAAGGRGRRLSSSSATIGSDAYSEADERLVSTVASSMGVALANARLFDETKRLLAETDQRAAELALINEIGSALAAELEFAAIVELVGERLRQIFARQARDMFIALVDRAANRISYPYWFDDGKRLEVEPNEIGGGLTSVVVTSKRPLRLDTLAR